MNTDELFMSNLYSQDMHELISEMISKKRKEMRMTQKSFGAYLGVSRNKISKMETGEYNYTIQDISNLFAKLDVIPMFKIIDITDKLEWEKYMDRRYQDIVKWEPYKKQQNVIQ